MTRLTRRPGPQSTDLASVASLDATSLAGSRPFLFWLMGLGLVAFLLFVAWHVGLLGAMYRADRSFLTVVISAVLVVASAYLGFHIFLMSRELDRAFALERLYASGASGRRPAANDNNSHAVRFVKKLETLRRRGAFEKTAEGSVAALLESYATLTTGPVESGWFVADVMVKLGLLGTVIGFIFMLASVDGLRELDASSAGQLLTRMSAGMKVALYTTLAGIVGSLLVAVQCHPLQRLADTLQAALGRLAATAKPV